ncbi:MAG: transcriptional repressor [Eubacteriales bacterium]|nr:transcriptional repressor [Eubacteriales bacterium]
MIEELVLQSKDHLTAEQIFLEMKKKYPGVVLATIYNNLNALCKEGKIRKVCVEGSPDRYDKTVRHDHLVCTSCGALADITLADLTELLEKQIGEDFLSYDLRINYICPKCRAKMKGEQQHE